MRYWWVNQNQTYRHEVPGGYMWSPKLQKDGHKNRAYELMRTVMPGDIVFSFAQSHIKAIGIAGSNCYEFPKPTEFGNAGSNWGNAGWRVDVSFIEIINPIKPKNHIATLRPLLPNIYSPLQPNGDGNQTYLFDISENLALGLAHLMERWVVDLLKGNIINDLPTVESSISRITEWEDTIEKLIESNSDITDTERERLIKSRLGQGKFRADLLNIEQSCRVTGVNNPTHLVASHTKPWRDSDNNERLDPENGFMLTPTIDHLFDRGFISFENNGDLIVSPVAHKESMHKMGLPDNHQLNVGGFSEGQKRYLEYHRESLLLIANI